MTDLDDLAVEEKFSLHVNAAMAVALRDGADPDDLAVVAGNTAYELYEHYDAGNEYDSFPAFVVDTAFRATEVNEWLDENSDSEDSP